MYTCKCAKLCLFTCMYIYIHTYICMYMFSHHVHSKIHEISMFLHFSDGFSMALGPPGLLRVHHEGLAPGPHAPGTLDPRRRVVRPGLPGTWPRPWDAHSRKI